MDDPYAAPVPPLTRPGDAPPVHSGTDLWVRWRQLMGPWAFDHRSLWVLWFDGDGFQLPMIVPIDDLPEAPDEQTVAHVMSLVTHVIRADGGPGTTVAMTLSRPGSPRVTDSDRAWAGSVRRQADRAGIALWPVHLATADAVRPLTLDDVGWAQPA